MKAFVASLVTLCLLVGALLFYSAELKNFGSEIFDTLCALPETPEECEAAGKQVLETCEELLDKFRRRELFIHLALPYERLESAHEKLILLCEYYKTRAFPDFCATRALCLEEVEILRDFENISLPNLI